MSEYIVAPSVLGQACADCRTQDPADCLHCELRIKTLASESQPAPETQDAGDIVLGHVLTDIRERAVAGYEKYGTALRVHNGRDPLWDAYQEAIDLVMYLRQELLKREEKSDNVQRQF